MWNPRSGEPTLKDISLTFKSYGLKSVELRGTCGSVHNCHAFPSRFSESVKNLVLVAMKLPDGCWTEVFLWTPKRLELRQLA